jgi:hypothetical protein
MKKKSVQVMSLTMEQQLKNFDNEINELRALLPEQHLTKSDEHDYDIKSQIIQKQNQMIELLINKTKGKVK